MFTYKNRRLGMRLTPRATNQTFGRKEKFKVISPSTCETIDEFPKSTRMNARRAIRLASIAYSHFRSTSCKERSLMLSNWANLLAGNKAKVARLINLETGKPVSEASAEVDSCIDYFQWFSGEALRQYGETVPSQALNVKHWTVREPIGVAGVITPWNFPVAMLVRKVSAALAAGCTVVAKPSELTPLSASALLSLSVAAGIPKGVVNMICGNAVEIGDEICSNPLMRKISFTGSSEVGRIIQQKSVGKRVSLELGGNAPFIVCSDADLSLSVSALIQAKFRNCGQTCVAPNRVLVFHKILPQFKKELLKQMKTIGFTNCKSKAVTIGPLISKTHKDKVTRLTKNACAHGGKIIYQASDTPKNGFYFPPTVIQSIHRQNPVWREEIFGPVIMITSFKNEEEAIALANDTTYGLAAYVFTQNVHSCARFSDQLQFGMVGINEAKISNAMVPFGGCKGSGMGKEGSRHGIEEYSQIKLCTARV